MKKVVVLFISTIILGSFFASCTKEDNGPVDMNLIEGKWIFDKSTVTSPLGTINYPTNYFKNEDGCSKDYVEILSGGTVKYADFGINCALTENDVTWTQSGNAISIQFNGSGDDETFNVTTLTATELVLKINGTYEGLSGTLNMYFTK
jgi:hypothetical protein